MSRLIEPPYPVQLILNPEGEWSSENPLVSTLLRDDGVIAGDSAPGVANLDIRAEPLSSHLTAEEFVRRFHGSEAVELDDALAFGRLLLHRLLEEPRVGALWKELALRRGGHRPLRLEVVFPRSSSLAELPFELLADDTGFLFKGRLGNILVRSFRKMGVRTAELRPGDRAAFIWTNPLSELGEIGREIVEGHAEEIAGLSELGLEVLEPLSHATRSGLARFFETSHPIPLVSLLAHGYGSGGELLLHRDGHDDYPRDPGDPIAGPDLAAIFRKGGVEAALLWSCHGGRSHPSFGSIAESLLTDDGGDLAAVLTAHAALRATATKGFLGSLLRSLGRRAGGRLELAVSEARESLPIDDLQWAAPVLYARPHGDRSVSLERALANQQAIQEPLFSTGLEGSPQRALHFRGREKELKRGVALLSKHRLVSLLGMPGIGKTELSLAIAEEILQQGRPSFSRALWFSLAGLTQVDSLRGQLALALTEKPVETDGDLARLVGPRSLLLVLDNAEDLIRGDRNGLRALAETLLQACPGVHFLVATRMGLGSMAGIAEEEVEVRALQSPADREAFVAAAGPRLREEEKSSPIIGAIVNRLDGHPLSIALVASQVGRRDVDLEGLKRRLERKRLENLKDYSLLGGTGAQGGQKESPSQSFQASVALTFDPLEKENPLAGEIFCWLGLFPAGMPSLLVPLAFGEDGEEAAAALLRCYLADRLGGHSRLVLLAPFRLFARRRLETVSAARREEVLKALFSAYSQWQALLYSGLATRPSFSVAAALLEHANVDSFLDALEKGVLVPASASANHLATAFSDWARVSQYGGRQASALPLLLRARQALASTATSSGLAALDLCLGHLYLRTDRLSSAEESYSSALPLYREIEARLGEAHTLKALGDLYLRTDRLSSAAESYSSALPLYREIEDRLGEANTLKALGDLYLRTDRLSSAAESYSSALPLYREIGDRLGEANTLQGFGDLWLARKEAALAFDWFLEAHQLQEEIEDHLGIAGSYVYLARAALTAGLAGRAVVLGSRALEKLQEVGSAWGQILALDDLGKAFLALESAAPFVACQLLAWRTAKDIRDSSEVAREKRLSQLIESFDAVAASEDLFEESAATLGQAIREQADRLRERDEDPMAPLSGEIPELP